MAAPDDDFWQVFHHSRNPMLLFDDRRRYRDLNDAAADCFGRPREELLRGRVGDRTPADLQRQFEEVFPELVAGRRLTMPWALVRPDGTRTEVFLHVHPNAFDDQHLLLFLSAPPEFPAGGLTPRERQITGLLAEGFDGREIADKLMLSPETVRTHIRNGMQRVGARTRAHLIAIALREHLIDS